MYCLIEILVTWHSDNHLKLSSGKANELVDYSASNMGVAAKKLQILFDIYVKL